MNYIKKYIANRSINQNVLMFIVLFLISACEDNLTVEDPSGQIPHEHVFENEITATAAVTTLYAKLRDEVLLTGKILGLGVLKGMYSDELDYYGFAGQPMETFYYHQVLASDMLVSEIWNGSYKLIYMSNSILNGLETSTGLTEEVKGQLRGEVLFFRAFIHFYIVNMFGDFPYITSTDYEINRLVDRTPKDQVYQAILLDLNEANSLLNDTDISGEHTRINKWTVKALLSRVYLYMEQWGQAENESSQIIGSSSLFNMESGIENEFLKESASTIWQLKPKIEGDNTDEGNSYQFSVGPPQVVALSPVLVNQMEEQDLRKVHWVKEVTDGANLWYAPNKYKESSNTGTSLEYSKIFRLAEQYLIRAEARARQGNILGAKQDLDIIRERAGLLPTTAETPETVLEAILTERRFELFTEHGHRWFDLKRFNKANEVLAPLKPGWLPSNVLLPIPETEILMNPNLNPQNPGY